MSMISDAIGSVVKPVAEGIKDVAVAREKSKQVADTAMAWSQVAASSWRPWLARYSGWSMACYVAGTVLFGLLTLIGIMSGAEWADMSTDQSSLGQLWGQWKGLGGQIFSFAALFLTTYAGSRGIEKVADSIGGEGAGKVADMARLLTGNRSSAAPDVTVTTVTAGTAPAQVRRMEGITVPERAETGPKQPVEPFELPRKQLEAEIEREEMRMECVYLDSKGLPTAGIGHLLTDADPECEWPVDTPVSAARVDQWFSDDVDTAIRGARRVVPGYDTLPTEAQLVLANMAFQMGAKGLAGFRRTLQHVMAGEWEAAADEALDSQWARDDSPARARRMTMRLRQIGQGQIAA